MDRPDAYRAPRWRSRASGWDSVVPTTLTLIKIATPRSPGRLIMNEIDVAIGVTHAPYRRVIDAMAYDGHDLIIAGHTHGGQVCVPFYGALVTNCDLDTRRAKGPVAAQRWRSDGLDARLRGCRDVPVCADPLRLPARGDPAHPDKRQWGDFCRVVSLLRF